MQSFTDYQGPLWDVVISVDTVRRIRRVLDIDLLAVEPFLKQLQDVVSLCDILYVICEREAKERNVDSEEFGRRLFGQTLREAKEALMEAYINFIPDPAAAEKLRVVKDRYAVVGEKMLSALEAKMPKIIQRIDAEVESTVKKIEHDIESELQKTTKPISTG